MPIATGPLVAGIDFSPESRRALDAAAALARAWRCPLHLVAAVEPLLAEAARLRHQLPAFMDQVEKDLREFAAPVATPADSVSFEAAAGEPAPVLLAAAARVQARLIVVGTRGRGRAARLMLGSTTLRLLRAADRPILVTDLDDRGAAADAAMAAGVTHLVCGVDFSDGSLAAVEVAGRWATTLGATITLVHALPRAGVPVGWDALAAEVEADRLRQATTRLADVARKMKLQATVRAGVGSPAHVLAEESGSDLHAIVVVGLRGSSHHRPGSTALSVLATTRVPVLAVPESRTRSTSLPTTTAGAA